MAIKTAKRLEKIPEYIQSRLSREMKKVEEETGRKVLNFSQGTPDFKPSKNYMQKLHEFFDEPTAHLYPGYGANPAFADALMDWYQSRFGVQIEKNELLPLLGGKDGLSHLPIALFDEGDEILIPDPGYPAFNEPALLVGAKTVPYDLLQENDFKMDYKNIESKITKKSKAIWVNYPSNPTGQFATLEELEELVAFVTKHNLILLYDNAYSEITFNGIVAPSILQIKGAKDIAVEFSSFSKTFSFAGFRMGWVVGNKVIVAALAKVKSQIDSGLTLPFQNLAAHVLTTPDTAWHKAMIESYLHRKDIIAEHVKKMGLTFHDPKAALYIWAKIPEGHTDSEKYSLDLLKTKQILFTPGTAFGNNGKQYVRISYCVNIDKIDEYFV